MASCMRRQRHVWIAHCKPYLNAKAHIVSIENSRACTSLFKATPSSSAKDNMAEIQHPHNQSIWSADNWQNAIDGFGNTFDTTNMMDLQDPYPQSSPFSNNYDMNSPLDPSLTQFDTSQTFQPNIFQNHNHSHLLSRPRRSVSEPPLSGQALPHQHHPAPTSAPPAAPPVFFHRDDLYLGAPLTTSSRDTTSTPEPSLPPRLRVKRAAKRGGKGGKGSRRETPATRGRGRKRAREETEEDEDEVEEKPVKRMREWRKGKSDGEESEQEVACSGEKSEVKAAGVSVPLSVEALRELVREAVVEALLCAKRSGDEL